MDDSHFGGRSLFQLKRPALPNLHFRFATAITIELCKQHLPPPARIIARPDQHHLARRLVARVFLEPDYFATP
jgi:hypothetical protein